ncbi:unnamed protein product, partial [Bubo scandiacus]
AEFTPLGHPPSLPSTSIDLFHGHEGPCIDRIANARNLGLAQSGGEGAGAWAQLGRCHRLTPCPSAWLSIRRNQPPAKQ